MKFKLMKENKFKKALGKIQAFVTENKRKIQFALPTLGLVIALAPGAAYADEAPVVESK